jgi:hypothetical protein
MARQSITQFDLVTAGLLGAIKGVVGFFDDRINMVVILSGDQSRSDADGYLKPFSTNVNFGQGDVLSEPFRQID